MRSLLAIILLSLMTATGYGQHLVTGRVTEQSGTSLPGVNVVIKGTTNGTVTNADGVYKIVAKKTDSLVFSYIGYQKVSKYVGNRKTINVVMHVINNQLNELVVVGYGTMRKSDVTGATSTVKVKTNVAREYNTVDQLLQGRAAGVQVISNNGNPGMGISVQIRGINSLRGNNQPLYVVDGVPITSAGEDAAMAQKDGNSLSEKQNGLAGLNPSDIASIEVLKDASATAIYGSRGANGVVLITTKKGRSGKMNIDGYFTTGISNISKKLSVLDGVDYAQYRNEVAIMNGQNPNFYIDNNQVYTVTYENGQPVISKTPSRTVNWQDEIYKPGWTYTAGASFSGGTKKGTFYVSADYTDVSGIVSTSRMQSGSFRINLTENLTKKFKIDGRLSLYYSQGTFAQDGDKAGANRSFIKSVLTYSPIIGDDVENLDIDLGLSNPYSWLNDFEDVSKQLRSQASLRATYQLPIKGLKFQITGGANIWTKERKRWYGLTTFQGAASNGRLSMGSLQKYSWVVNNLLLYNRVFKKKHSINAMAGYVYDGIYRVNSSYEVTDFSTTTFTVDGPQYGSLITAPLKTSPTTEVMNSFLTRLNYSYDRKYIATVTFRADGSSKFAEGNKYSFFPSFSLAWLASEESFIKKLNVFSLLKVRAGWGQTGNQAISPYQTFANYDIAYYAQADNSTGIAFVPVNIANPKLKWETTTQTNVGFDLGFFNGKLTATVDAYYKETDDLLQKMVLPSSTGYSVMMINRGSISNKGIDISVNGVAIAKKDMNLSIGGNISFNRNKILYLGIPDAPVYIDGKETMASFYMGDPVSTGNYFHCPANIFMVGQPIGMFWGWKTDGIYQADDPNILPGFQPGDVKIVDLNGDGKIDLNDRTFIGNPNPDFTYGFNLDFTYKRLSLTVTAYGTYGNQIANGLAIEYYTATGSESNLNPAAYHDAWRPDKPSNSYPRVLYQGDQGAPAITDRIIEDGSYFRITNLTIGYDIPVKHTVQKLHVYASAQNLLTITGYSGYDPNVTSFLYNGNIQGVDWNAFPSARTYIIGLNIRF
ncbi:TonB-dependent receptor [Candidatus Sulfidibacterium hydrothermale]|uniref:SusC/RagA family TonB-linked outer membrane protein n=1 Tax=Candidatus Sulfidibacterium hydrothermale TaxID=2875962 RepID=UPI001F0A77E8|nr:TonB-dependent receptor [Candidatus Sulfidibacterium hydrothermale]UBM63392.1 TonB-dependent receptor [Candidatus Sulfidibacterium hydrothermale]